MFIIMTPKFYFSEFILRNNINAKNDWKAYYIVYNIEK